MPIFVESCWNTINFQLPQSLSRWPRYFLVFKIHLNQPFFMDIFILLCQVRWVIVGADTRCIDWIVAWKTIESPNILTPSRRDDWWAIACWFHVGYVKNLKRQLTLRLIGFKLIGLMFACLKVGTVNTASFWNQPSVTSQNRLEPVFSRSRQFMPNLTPFN